MRKFLIIMTLFIAIGAVGGAIMMWVDPSGNGWGGADAYQEASVGILGRTRLRHNLDALDCVGMVGMGIQSHQQHLFRIRVD